MDINVLVSALRSQKGASFRLLSLLDGGQFQANVSVPLVLEYEQVVKRHLHEIGLTESEIGDVLDYVCLVANRHKIFFFWRPFLRGCLKTLTRVR